MPARHIMVCSSDPKLGDYEWVRGMWSESIVYNRSTPVEERFLKMVNVSSEGGVMKQFLRYILDHYEVLADVTIFVAGNIQDHISCVSKYVKSTYPTDPNTFLDRLTQEAKQMGTSQNFSTTYPFQVSSSFRQLHVIGKIHDTGMPFGNWFYQLFGHFPEGDFYAFPSACFAIRQDRILQRPKAFYDFLLQNLHLPCNEFMYYMDRIWYYMFQPVVSGWTNVPDNIAVVCYGNTNAPFLKEEDGLSYSVNAYPALCMVDKYVLQPLRNMNKLVTVYLCSNPHASLDDYARLLGADHVKTKNNLTIANAWKETRRLFPKLWQDHEFIIAIHSHIMLSASIEAWTIDSAKLNFEGKNRELQAFSTAAIEERKITPSFIEENETGHPLFTYHQRRITYCTNK